MTEVFDASDSKQVDKSIKAVKDRSVRLREALRTIMSRPDTRAWLYHLLVDFESAYRSPYSKDPIQMAFNCGGHNVVLQLLTEMETCSPDLYLVMIKENQSDGRPSNSEPRQSRLNGDSVADAEPDADADSNSVA